MFDTVESLVLESNILVRLSLLICMNDVSIAAPAGPIHEEEDRSQDDASPCRTIAERCPARSNVIHVLHVDH